MYITFYSVIHTKTKYTAILNNYVRKLIKLLLTATTCPLVDMVFTCDFSTSISGDPGDVGGTANSSAVLSCSADTLTGPVLHTLDLLVMVMELIYIDVISGRLTSI